jgi:hypothetical protein
VPPVRYGDFFGMFSFGSDICLAAAADKDPTYSEAMASLEKEQWEAAIQEELMSLDANGTYTAVPIPPGCKLLPLKWVLKKKFTAAGDFERYKARLVAKGFKQIEGIDYTETFSPTSKYATVRTLFSKAAADDMELEHVDIKTAFLHGELQEVIYTTFPPGMPGPPGHCLKLHKTLYGLKQAPRAWHLRLEEELKRLGYTPSLADPALYTNTGTPDKKVYLLVYVDDIIVASGDSAACNDAKKKLLTAFDGRDLGPVTSFLGINVTRDRANRRLSMDQASSIKELLSTYGMDSAKPKAVPMDPGLRMSVQEGSPLSLTSCTYPNLIGSLMYLAVSTRPDIAFTVGTLARFTARPTTISMAAAKGLLRYLAGTADLRLTFSGSTGDKTHRLAIYTDADYAACPDTRKSVSGYVVILNGGAVDWRSKKQTTVTLSTTEAEYVAASGATRETLWFRQLARTLDLQVPCYNICADNQSMLKLAKNPILSARSKHIDIIHHFLRERVARGEVIFTYVPTDKMLADILTKALPKSKHQECCKALGLM